MSTQLPLQLNSHLQTSKVRQLVDAITAAIRNHTLAEGDKLPSVNEISASLGIARDTVFKAYLELKKQGTVESTRAKGYHVASARGKIFLFLDAYSTYKDILYNAFIESLGTQYTVDLAFHHYNEDVFETVIAHSLGKYNYYVVMNINNYALHPALQTIQKDKLLLLDWGNFEKNGFAYVNQNFGEEPYKCLLEAKPLFQKYTHLVYVNNRLSQHPSDTKEWFSRFCAEENYVFSIVPTILENEVVKGKVFFLVHHLDVVQLIKIAIAKNLTPGKDIGIFCYNDSPMFEVINKGITVISTNFALMGQLAANFILHKQPIQTTVPTSLIKRGTL